MRDFQSFHLHPRIEAGIAAAGYTAPMPIQAQCIPPILARRDVMGLAQTGTGKTAAFALPILQRLLDGPGKGLRALVIAPTRELAEQTHGAFTELGRKTGLKSAAIYGGVSKERQIRQLRKGIDIAVACPGRLLDLLEDQVLALSGVKILVLDEADRMFDMGFLPDVRRILREVPVERQTLLFSATMPDDIRTLAADVLRDPVTIQIGETAPVTSVFHALYPVPQHLKTPLLLTLLERTAMPSVLVFTRTKHRATRLAEQMNRAGFATASLQGDLPQHKRQAALEGFRAGRYRILVATDIAARGIDVTGISHVVNYDMPDTVDAYTHRIGRTGRASCTGDAFTFVTMPERAFVWSIEKALGEPIETRTLADFNYAVPAPAPRSAPDRRSSAAGGRRAAPSFPSFARPEASAAARPNAFGFPKSGFLKGRKVAPR